MGIKVKSTATVYEVEITQVQLDKLHALLSCVSDNDTDSLFYEIDKHVSTLNIEVINYNGEMPDGLEFNAP